jgi:hypothetical protein
MKQLKKNKNSFSLLLSPLTTADRILIVVLILFAITSLFFVSFLQTKGDIVQIFLNNQMKYQYKLTDEKNLIIKNQEGFIQIVVKDKKVWVDDSSCPAKICKKMGKISKTGQTIVCVPNKIFIQIIGKNKEKYIDAITH